MAAAATQKIALVTGGSKGLGFALARILSRQGYFILLNARDAKNLEVARKGLPFPAAAGVLAADVSGKTFAAELQKVMHRCNLTRLDLVVHAAAVNHMGKIQDTKAENAEATFRVNAYSVLYLAQATRAYLEQGYNPQFVLVSSLMKYFAMPGRSIYAASKAAAEQFAGAWAHELRAEKSPIRVKIFRPAGIETGFHSNTKTDGMTPRSDVSRMSAEESAQCLLRLIQSGRREMAPGLMNKIVSFVARHFAGLTRFLVARRYLKNGTGTRNQN